MSVNNEMHQVAPWDCSRLRNRYFVLRHGHSEANEKGLIASSPELALSQFGLTRIGRDQVVRSLEEHLDLLASVDQICTSDFRRTRETAEIAGRMLQASIMDCIPLRERGFGQWDGQSDENYHAVWSADADDPRHQRWGVESVFAVAQRMSEFMRDLDQSRRDQTILLISHGDPLQILLTAASGRDLRCHRQLDPLKTAEIRRLRETSQDT